MMLSSQNVQTITHTIDVDPAGTDTFHLLKAPRALSVVGAQMVSHQALGEGTAGQVSAQNWGTAGTAVQSGGTITPATGAGIEANTPTAMTVNEANHLAEGEWLVLSYTELGGGWQSGDRLHIQIDYVMGKG